jgi:hypothetical protein
VNDVVNPVRFGKQVNIYTEAKHDPHSLICAALI